MTSGIVISKFKPRARYLAAWNVIVEGLEVIGYLSYTFLSCGIDDLHGEMKSDNRYVCVCLYNFSFNNRHEKHIWAMYIFRKYYECLKER